MSAAGIRTVSSNVPPQGAVINMPVLTPNEALAKLLTRMPGQLDGAIETVVYNYGLTAGCPASNRIAYKVKLKNTAAGAAPLQLLDAGHGGTLAEYSMSAEVKNIDLWANDSGDNEGIRIVKTDQPPVVYPAYGTDGMVAFLDGYLTSTYAFYFSQYRADPNLDFAAQPQVIISDISEQSAKDAGQRKPDRGHHRGQFLGAMDRVGFRVITQRPIPPAKGDRRSNSGTESCGSLRRAVTWPVSSAINSEALFRGSCRTMENSDSPSFVSISDAS